MQCRDGTATTGSRDVITVKGKTAKAPWATTQPPVGRPPARGGAAAHATATLRRGHGERALVVVGGLEEVSAADGAVVDRLVAVEQLRAPRRAGSRPSSAIPRLGENFHHLGGPLASQRGVGARGAAFVNWPAIAARAPLLVPLGGISRLLAAQRKAGGITCGSCGSCRWSLLVLAHAHVFNGVGLLVVSSIIRGQTYDCVSRRLVHRCAQRLKRAGCDAASGPVRTRAF